jgi:4-amino-4-deoxy-L-arabinose transferase-like glycosyltransferase
MLSSQLARTPWHKRPEFAYVTLLLWVVPLVLMQSPGQSLMTHDEGIYAIQARSMLETGDWITPQWGGQISFDRTVGIQWLIACCYGLLGQGEMAARLPSQIAFVGTVLLLYRLTLLIFQQRSIAWLSAAILAITPLSLQYGKLATQDSVLVLIELIAAAAMLEAERSGQKMLLMLTGAALGWGFMIKGFMVIPAAIAFLPYLILQRLQHRHLFNPWLYFGLAIGWVPVISWLWAATQKYGRQPIEELFFKLFYLKDTLNYDAGPLYYFWNIPANGFPWVFFAIAGMALVLNNPACHQLVKRHWGLVLGFPLTLFVELTLFKTRTHYYPLQLFPWLAIFAALCIERLMQGDGEGRSRRWLGLISWVFAGLGVVLVIAGVLGLTQRFPALPGIEPEEIFRVAVIGLTLGLGWVLLGLNGLMRKRGRSRIQAAKQWLVLLLLPMWLGLGLLGLTGLWGDYAPSLRMMLQDPTIAPIVQMESIDLVAAPLNLDRGSRKRYLLLSLYTPHPGQHFRQWEPTDLAWVDPNLAAQKPSGYRLLAEYYGWELLQKIN